MLEFLPENIKEGLSHVNVSYVYELRLRADKPVTVNIDGEYRYLSRCGVTAHRERAIHCTYSDLADCVYRAGNYSVYSVEEQIKKGFLTAKHGERIGLAGEYVFENGKPLALRNFTSLCIRVPHETIGCGKEIYKKCMSDKVYNLLLMSSPGLGKTTILRDLGRILSEKTRKNILICDERGEISSGVMGESCDIIKFSDKETAFEAGIRAMRPDIIITDELSVYDLEVLKKAIYAGITVLASAHFSSMERVGKQFLEIFDRFVLLDELKIGKIKGIYDHEGKELI